VIEPEPFALVPFERRKHQLIFPHRSAEKNRHAGKTFRRRLAHQIGHLFVERAINDYTQCAVVWVVRGNEKHRAPKIRIEHIGMSDEQ